MESRCRARDDINTGSIYIFAIGQFSYKQLTTNRHSDPDAYERWNICFSCSTWNGINGYTKQDVAWLKKQTNLKVKRGRVIRLISKLWQRWPPRGSFPLSPPPATISHTDRLLEIVPYIHGYIINRAICTVSLFARRFSKQKQGDFKRRE